jgi:hypothetical protein
MKGVYDGPYRGSSSKVVRQNGKIATRIDNKLVRQ